MSLLESIYICDIENFNRFTEKNFWLKMDESEISD